jgi:hypothetical protein
MLSADFHGDNLKIIENCTGTVKETRLLRVDVCKLAEKYFIHSIKLISSSLPVEYSVQINSNGNRLTSLGQALLKN